LGPQAHTGRDFALALIPRHRYDSRMSNTLAISLIILVVGFLALDHYVLHWDVALFAMRKLIGMIDTLAIWR